MTTSLEQEYGSGYLDPWGYITHSESISIEHSKILSGETSVYYRRRGYTHTLSISGTLQYSIQRGTIRIQKDRLTEHIESMKDNPSNFGLPINAGFYPSVVVTPENTVFEPVNLEWTGGTIIDNQTYSATFVFKIFPLSSEIKDITIPSFNNISLWDGSTYSTNVVWDKAKKKQVNTITISASIKCPDQMPWSKAIEYYEKVELLSSSVSEALITNLSFEKNFDQQTVSYSITGENTVEGGDQSKIVKIFGYEWSVHGTLQISNEQSKVPVSEIELNTRISSIPYIENLNYSLSVTAPGEVGLISKTEGTGLPDVTMMEMLTNARSIRPGQFLKGLEFTNTDYSDWIGIVDPNPNALWEIISSNSSFDPLNKQLSVSISARRARETEVHKTLAINNGLPFLWNGCGFSYSSSSDVASFIFVNNINVSGNIVCPNDMTYLQAKEIFNEINSLEQFDNQKYPKYKLINKTNQIDPIQQNLSFSLQFQQTDIYSFFDEHGDVRAPRSCIWDFGIFDGMSNLQVDVTYSVRANVTEDDRVTNELTVDVILRENPNTYVEKSSNIETAFEQLWNRFIVNKDRLGNGQYRISGASKQFSSSRLEGQMNLTFTDDGKNSLNSGNYIDYYGLILSDPKYNVELPKKRFSTLIDGSSDGDFAQDHGLDIVRISLSGRIQSRFYDTISPPKNRIYTSEEFKNGYLYIAGISGRVSNISINPDPVARTADFSVSIEAQPRTNDNQLNIPSFEDNVLGLLDYNGQPL